MVFGRQKKSNYRIVLQTTARTERIEKMENNATQNQIRLFQKISSNIAGLAAGRTVYQSSQLKDPPSLPPPPLTTTDYQAGLRQLK